MNQRIFLVLGLVSASGLAALIGACGGGDATVLDGGDDATVDGSNDTGTGNDTGTNDTGTGNDSGGDSSSPCQGSDAGCRACCAGLYPDAAAAFIAIEHNCACTTPGDCNTGNRCGNNFCNGGLPNQACNACLDNPEAGACLATAASACLGDNACAPLIGCVLGCGGGNPGDAGGGG